MPDKPRIAAVQERIDRHDVTLRSMGEPNSMRARSTSAEAQQSPPSKLLADGSRGKRLNRVTGPQGQAQRAHGDRGGYRLHRSRPAPLVPPMLLGPPELTQ